MIIIIFNSVDNMTSFVHISVDVRVRCVKLDFNDHPSPILKTKVWLRLGGDGLQICQTVFLGFYVVCFIQSSV